MVNCSQIAQDAVSRANELRTAMALEGHNQAGPHRQMGTGLVDLLVSAFEGSVVRSTELEATRADLAARNAAAGERIRGLEARLEILDARLRDILDKLSDSVFLVDDELKVLDMNRRAEELLGRPRLERIGKPALDLVCKDDVERLGTAVDRLRTEGRAQLEAIGVTRADGSSLLIDVSASVVDSGPRRTFLAIVRDVTEAKRTQAQLVASDRLVSVGTLAASVAHEINNPLASVIANLDLALADLGDQSLVQEALRDARDAADRVRLIVRDLKVFSRPEDERRGPVDIQRVIESALRMAWNEVRHRARLVKDYGRVPHVDGNEARLGQVILNLVVNAAQAIPEGNADHNEIRIATALDPSGRVVVEVRDTGPGIPPELQDRIFLPFFTTKPRGAGTGLGLSICHRIVTGLGGEIQVESPPGEGTRFRLLLPVAELDGEDTQTSLRTLPRSAVHRGRILVIDDEPAIAAIVRRVLAAEHDVVTTSSAVEALERLRAGERFDVLLCDLMMPQVSGMDLYAEVLRMDPDVAARIVFLTGGAFTPSARAFLDEVANQRIEKPFDTQGLRALVNDRVR